MKAGPLHHRVEIDGGVATVTLDRPQAYNALTSALLTSLLGTMRALDRDPQVRAIVLTGAGKGFCSGQALDDTDALPAGSASDLGVAVRARYNPLIATMLGSAKPYVAAVNGVAAGAGMGLACACDFRVVGRGASFTTAFVRIGLVPDSGLSFTLPRIVGYAKAVELSLLSEKVDAARADQLGLCTKVVADEDVLREAQELAAALANGPLSLGLIKRELLRNGAGDLHAALEYEAEMQSIAGTSADFAEGLAAFTAKRSPAFRGD
jgi:2-(1,2-epoxy-1,2-dihydrophenyl)acetyl-CoA isomerase